MGRPAVIRGVRVERAPGFDRDRFPEVSGLRPGLNVVWGPNGAGKSTLARTLRALLWPDPGAGLEAVAELAVADETWRLERRGPELRQTRAGDGQVSAGHWGEAATAERYWFPLHELLQAQTRDPGFQDYLRSQVQGGVDLEAASRAAGGADRPLAPTSREVQAHKAALLALRELQAAQAAQRGLRDELEAAGQAVEDARAASLRLDRARAALGYLEAADREARLQAELERFPEGLERLSPDDPGRLEDLRRQTEALRARADAQRADLEETRRKRADLTVDLTDPSLEARLEAWVETLRRREAELDQARRALEPGEAAEHVAREQLAWLLPEPPKRALLQAAAGRLRALAVQVEPLRGALEAARRQAAALGEPEPVAPGDTGEAWAQVHGILDAWRREAQAAAPGEPLRIPAGRRGWAAGAALVLPVAAVLLAVRYGPAAAAPVALLGPVLVWILLRPGAAGPAEAGRAAIRAAGLQSQAERLLDPWPELRPRSWTPEATLDLQREALARAEAARARDRRNADREAAVRACQAAEAAYARWLETWRPAAEALGLRPDQPDLQGAPFCHWAEHLENWLERAEAAAAARRDRDARQRDRDLAAVALRQLLGGAPTPGEAPDLLGRARDLLERRAAARALLEREREQEAELARLGQELVAQAELEDAFWLERGFERPEPERLAALAAQVEPRRAVLLDLAQAGRDRAARADPEALAAARGRTADDLRADLPGLAAAAAGLEAASRAQGELNQRYQGLLDGDALARALDQERRAREALALARRENLLGRAVHLLARDLADRIQVEEQPAVLDRAGGWLKRFTGHRLTLGFRPDRGWFVRDLAGGRVLALDELSSGTRVQALFAVRLAFIEELEGSGVGLPVFLDEILANSDDARGQAMIQVVLEMARDRQVFYFTAQGDEVAKLRAAAGPDGLHEVPLGELDRAEERRRLPLRPVPLEIPRVPEPMADYQAFGTACGVPGADLFAPVEALHAWHLFTRSQDLREVLRRGFERIGQVLAADLPGAPALQRRAGLLDRARILAGRGRGRPFPAGALEAAEDLELNRRVATWPALLEAAQRAEGDGTRFLALLDEVPRLRGTTRERVADWLREHGYVGEGEPLALPDLLQQLHREFSWLRVDSEDRTVVERYLRQVLPD